MIYLNCVLTCLLVVEVLNLVIRLIKIAPEKEPPLDEEIRIKLYC